MYFADKDPGTSLSAFFTIFEYKPIIVFPITFCVDISLSAKPLVDFRELQANKKERGMHLIPSDTKIGMYGYL